MTYLPKHKPIHIHSFIDYTSLMLLNFHSLDTQVYLSLQEFREYIEDKYDVRFKQYSGQFLKRDAIAFAAEK